MKFLIFITLIIPLLISCGSDTDTESGIILSFSKSKSSGRTVENWSASTWVGTGDITCLGVFASVPDAGSNKCQTDIGDIPVTVARGYFPVEIGKQEVFVPIPSGPKVRIAIVAMGSLAGCPSIKFAHTNSTYQTNSRKPLIIFSEVYDLPPGGVVKIDGNILNSNITNPLRSISSCFGPAFGD